MSENRRHFLAMMAASALASQAQANPLGLPLGLHAGQGVMDWKRLFAAARGADVKGLHVEQEAPRLPSSLDAAKPASILSAA